MRQHPRDHRVRVPHVRHAQLVAPPHRCRDLVDQRQRVGDLGGVLAQAHRAGDGEVQIGHVAAGPTSDLVAEEAEPSERGQPDRSLRHHPSPPRSLGVRDRGHLDNDLLAVLRRDEGGVVEVAGFGPTETRHHPLVDPTAAAHHPGSGSERYPVQIEGGRWRHVSAHHLVDDDPHDCTSTSARRLAGRVDDAGPPVIIRPRIADSPGSNGLDTDRRRRQPTRRSRSAVEVPNEAAVASSATSITRPVVAAGMATKHATADPLSRTTTHS